jgi:ABC-type dipeptide/oligopeptide/nickel transport system ATPase component
MKKIDLHIHTVPSISDSRFDFSMDKLEEYVTKVSLDCIAITNHNLFDFEQFKEISNKLSIKVLPGIEIDVERGHLLLIAENDDFQNPNFKSKCDIVQSEITSPTDYISIERLFEIFGDLKDYLVIPHYDKSPRINNECLERLKPNIQAGEVSSLGKFKRHSKLDEGLTPVLFSDMRMSENLENFVTRHCWVETEEISINSLKMCFSDKSKVTLTKEDGNDFFQANDYGLMLSTGLNIILGERSSGKSVTLDKISHSIPNHKYIKQFALIGDGKEKFNTLNDIRLSEVYNSFLSPFKKAVDEIIHTDLISDEKNIERYLNSLLKMASETERRDSFAQSKLYDEELYDNINLSNLNKMIESLVFVADNNEFSSEIDTYLDRNQLKKLIVHLIELYRGKSLLKNKQGWLNTIMQEIKDVLRTHSTSTYLDELDFYEIALNRKKVAKFNKLVNALKEEEIINREEIGRFSVVAKKTSFKNATEAKEVLRTRIAIKDAFEFYDDPYIYLVKLKEKEIDHSDLHKLFVSIGSQTINEYGAQVSGGEMSEFNLITEIKDASKYDILLIDEPESSFDNIFLKNEVNTLIKSISKNIPVVVATHNSTVGASIKPNYIISTQREFNASGEAEYYTYTGHPNSTVLKRNDGKEISNYDIILNCLEAGSDAYDARKNESYDVLKNR